MPESNGVVSNGHYKTLNDNFKRGDKIPLKTTSIVSPNGQPVSARYSTQTPDQVLDEEFIRAEAHKVKISKDEQRAYNWLKGFKITGLIALAIGGAAAGAAWSDANRYAAQDITHYALMLSTMIALSVGPWYASILTTHLEKGIYRGIGKMIAWSMVVLIVGDELLTMYSSRDPVFAAFFMVRIAPFVLPMMLLGATLQLYFRSSLKWKRDLAHMLDNEREIVTKNATDARTRRARTELRERRLGSVAEALSHYRTSFFNIIINSTWGMFSDMLDSWELYQIQRQKKRRNLKSKSKAVRASSKKAGQGRRK